MMYLAIIPGLVLFFVVWRADKVEKEPLGLLVKLFLFGGLSTVSAMIIGNLGGAVVLTFLDEGSLIYLLIDNFLLTALVEEGGKFFVLKKMTWKHKAFDYTFDAVVYAVTTSLGFATIENILYLIDSDVGTAIMRGVLSVPGHAIDAVYMGCYYGIARFQDAVGDTAASKSSLKKALIIPVLIHGFYDFCLSTNNEIFILVFLVFEVVITILAIRKFRRLAREDAFIPQPQPGMAPPVNGYTQQQPGMDQPAKD